MATTTRRKSATRADTHRRPRGTGTIRRRGDTFTACWFTIDPATGKRHQASKGGFANEADAQKHLNMVLAEVAAGTFRRDQRLTVKQLLQDHWLPIKEAEGSKPNTIAYHRYAAGWIIDRIGGLRVEALTPGTVAKMVAAMRTSATATGKTGLSARSVQAAVGTLKAATAWAARIRLVSVDPLAEFHRPNIRGEAQAVKAWDVSQARQFLNSVADDRFAVLWALMITRGLRRGELAGLKWSAIDLDNGTLSVRSARVVVKGQVLESSTKSGYGRMVPLDDRLVNGFRALRDAQASEAVIAVEAYQDHVYVMADALGRPMHPDSISRRFDALVAKTGVPRITVHGLRHTAGTLMLADGVPTKVVSDLLGHSSPVITLSIYAHVLPGMAEQAGENLSRALLD
jgi:integrase